MPKPNSSSTVKELKDYIKSHKLNHPEVKLSMRKSELQAGLKKIGHWSGARQLITGKGRPVKKKKEVHTLAAPRKIGAVARPRATRRPGAQYKGTGGAKMTGPVRPYEMI
tara:strand:+ start:272 stop:601 length:330 start_codon:yes stop_codon:yes gene_type:complete